MLLSFQVLLETLFYFLCSELYPGTVREIIANASKGLMKIISLLSIENTAISGLALIVILQICTLSCGRDALIIAANICTLLSPFLKAQRCNVQCVRRGHERAVLVAAALCRQRDFVSYGESDIATFCITEDTESGSGAVSKSATTNCNGDNNSHGGSEKGRGNESEGEREDAAKAKIRRMVYLEVLHTVSQSAPASDNDKNNNNNNNNGNASNCEVSILSLSDLIVLPLDKIAALKLSVVAGNVGAKAIATIVCHSDEEVLHCIVRH